MIKIEEKYLKIYQSLKLRKPLVIFDVEATGTNVSADKIIEIAYIKIRSNGVVVQKSILLDPEIPISDMASAVHGIYNDMVKGRSKFRERSQEIWEIFQNSYYGGFNIINFDLPMLRREFIRVGMDFNYSTKQIIDVKEIFQFMTPRNLPNAYEYYCHHEFDKPRSALNNSEAAAEVLFRQLDRYKEITDMEFIEKINTASSVNYNEYTDSTRKFYWRKGKAFFAISKYKDKSLSWVAREDPNFLRWLMSLDFSGDAKNIIKSALEGHQMREISSRSI